MKLLFDSHFNHFLDLYEPDIVFLDDVHVAEDAEAVQWYLDDWGLTRDDLKNAGLRVNKNTITISKGTPAHIKSMKGTLDPMNTVLQIKDIVIELLITMRADFVEVEVTPKDSTIEKILGSYDSIPPKSVKIDLYGYNVSDIIEAISEFGSYESKRYAFNNLKVMPKDEVVRMMTRWENLQRYKNNFENDN